MASWLCWGRDESRDRTHAVVTVSLMEPCRQIIVGGREYCLMAVYAANRHRLVFNAAFSEVKLPDSGGGGGGGGGGEP